MLFSQIKMFERGGKYQARIYHDGKLVKSGWRDHAANAYSDAESKLIYKPGYVQSVPRSEYL